MRRSKKLITSVVCAVLAGTSIASSAPALYADTIDDLKEQQQQLEQQQQELENQQESIKSQQTQTTSDIKELETQLTNYKSQREKLNQKMTELNNKIATTNKQLIEQQAVQNKQYSDMKLRIQYMYENQAEDMAMAVITSSDMSEALNNVEYYQKIYDYDRNQLEQIKETTDKIAGLKKDLESQLAEVQTSAEENNRLTEEVANLVSEKESLLDSLDTELAETAQYLINTKELAESNAQAIEDEEDRIAAVEAEAARQAAIAAAEAEAREAAANSYSSNNYYDDSDYTYSSGVTSSSLGERIASVALSNSGSYPAIAWMCAAWVSGVYTVAGATQYGGNAIDFWYGRSNYPQSGTSMSDIPLGAAVVTYPASGINAPYGHIGIYVGNGQVASNVGGVCVESVSSFASGKYGSWAGWVCPY